MSYAAVVDVEQVGDNEWEIGITETDCNSSSVATITNLPIVGTVLRQMCILQGGVATTVNPILGRNNPPSGDGVVVENETAAATIDTEGTAVYAVDGAASATLFHQSRPNAGNANTVRTIYRIRSGW